MPEVAICSLVRDGMEYLPAYRRQLESLSLPEGVGWRLYVLEGDSHDGSSGFLHRWAAEDPRVVVGHEEAGDSTSAEDRAQRWARVGNACFDMVPADGQHTHVLWLEADLCFPSDLVRRLLAHDVDVVAPVIFLGGLFYDTWGFRDVEGRRWTNEAPYHPDYRPMTLMEMGSVGSCVLFRRTVIDRGIRFRGTYEHGLLVGMCNDARAQGLRVFADTSTAILHPVGSWDAQMWRARGVALVDRAGRRDELALGEAQRLGLGTTLALLDPGTLLAPLGQLWPELFLRMDTNRLDMHVRASAQPRRSYQVEVRAAEPGGPGGPSPVRRTLLRMARRRSLQISPPTPAGEASALGGAFRCKVDIHLEAAP